MRVCVIIPFILDVWLVDVPPEVAQEEDHLGLLHLSSVMLAFIIFTRRIQSFLSLVDRKVIFFSNIKSVQLKETK